MPKDEFLKKVLSQYNLADPNISKLAAGLSSTVFLVTTNNNKYILKIDSHDSYLGTEVLFTKFLKLQGLPVADVVSNDKGELLSQIDDHSCVLFSFCLGSKIDGGELGQNASVDLANVISKIHRLMISNHDISASTNKRSSIDPANGIYDESILKKWTKIADEEKSIDFAKQRSLLIHGDLTRQNILISENQDRISAIIDFGDAHYDFVSWDLAILITHIFVTKSFGIDWEGLKYFFDEYFSLFQLSGPEVGALIPLMKIRNINLAIEVTIKMNGQARHQNKELESIRRSVLQKIDVIEENSSRLSKIFLIG